MNNDDVFLRPSYVRPVTLRAALEERYNSEALRQLAQALGVAGPGRKADLATGIAAAVLGQGLLRLHRGLCGNPRCPVALSVRWPRPPQVPARNCRLSDFCIRVSDTAVRRQRYARQSRERDIEKPGEIDEVDAACDTACDPTPSKHPVLP